MNCSSGLWWGLFTIVNWGLYCSIWWQAASVHLLLLDKVPVLGLSVEQAVRISLGVDIESLGEIRNGRYTMSEAR